MEEIKKRLWNKKRTETLKATLPSLIRAQKFSSVLFKCEAQRCGATRSKASNSFSVAQYRHC